MDQRDHKIELLGVHGLPGQEISAVKMLFVRKENPKDSSVELRQNMTPLPYWHCCRSFSYLKAFMRLFGVLAGLTDQFVHHDTIVVAVSGMGSKPICSTRGRQEPVGSLNMLPVRAGSSQALRQSGSLEKICKWTPPERTETSLVQSCAS